MSWIAAGRLRYERLVATHGRSVVLALAVLGLVAAGVTAVGVASPPTETSRMATDTVRVTADGSDSATVTGESELYERGEVVRDSPAYLTAAAPNLTVTAETSVSDGRSANVTQDLVLTYRAKRGGETYWEEPVPIGHAEGVAGDDPATVSATVNVADVRDRIEAIRGETGSRTTVSAVVVHRAAYETGSRSGELRSSAGLSVGDRSYSLGDGLGTSDTYHDREVVTRADEDRTTALFGVTVASWSLWSAPLALGFLLGAGHAGVVRRRGVDPRAVERRLERDRFAEWVSHGEVPDDVADRRVAIASLADLVDVAIDADRRVVSDRRTERYVVIDGNVAYVYAPDGPAAAEDPTERPAGGTTDDADPLAPDRAEAASGGSGGRDRDAPRTGIPETTTRSAGDRASVEGNGTDDVAARESADVFETNDVFVAEEGDDADASAAGAADEFVWSDPAPESDSEA
ncbi:DUF5305 domain-containing protein [Halostella sp. JP-L12]|uniref:DUF5305 family protein n=1 Tax=Halostella TaxID=1843185 RepID=UPI000EF7B381|nr:MULTISPECIES: DUF5305 family protein [Halostella]NHN46907.1 DUF5305 domain-containing protein [Halostella sp. JP-L12]